MCAYCGKQTVGCYVGPLLLALRMSAKYLATIAAA
jgi:hypothetical protein